MKIFILLLSVYLFISVRLFSQVYLMQNGTISTCSGMFYDSGGDTGPYSNNQNLTMTFTSSNGNRLQFTFQTFFLENGADFLEIFDGETTSAPLIGAFYGTISPGVITSTGTSLTFRFYSNSSSIYPGWSASISCTTPALTSYNMTNGQTITACSGVFYDSGGPNGNYINNENSIMTFCPETPNDYLVFNFPYQFDLSIDDTLWAYSGNSTNAPLIGIYTKSNIKEVIASPTPGTCVTFKFKSNNINNTAGWQGIFQCSSTYPTMSFNMGYGVRTVCSGNFYDSGGPTNDYTFNEDRIVTFISNNGNRLQINFQSFYILLGDMLNIYDGENTNAPLIGSFSGTSSPGTITSSGTSLTLHFYSNNNGNASGWSASISCTTLALTAYNMTNGQTITACSGVFYDSGGPTGNYSNNENFTMTFCPQTPNDYLVFNFPYQFDLSIDDTLWAYSGNSTNAPLIGIYTKNNIKEVIASPVPGTCVTFKFKSNSVNNTSGWQGIFQCSSTYPTLNFNMGYGVRYVCSGNFYDSGGPTNNYSNSEDRTVTFVANDGCVIRINFQLFNTENNIDQLFVYDGMNTNATLIGTYSGSNNPGTVTSSGQALTLRFISNTSSNYSGWQATISCPNLPAANAISNSPVCVGDTIQLSASGGQTYLWSGPSGFDSNLSQPAIINANTNHAGTYFVTVTSATGCTAIASTQVSIDQNVVNATANSNSPICSGQTLYLQAQGGNSYIWSGPNGFTSTLQNPSINNAGTVNSGTYTVTVTNGGACSDVKTMVVVVNQTPFAYIDVQGNTFYAQPSNASYQWFNCNTQQIIPGENNSTFTPTSNGNYAVIVTFNGCTDTSTCVTYTNHEFAAANNMLHIYPNPAKDVLSIESSQNSIQKIRIFDLAGKRIKLAENLNTQMVSISLYNIYSGLYIIEIELENGYKNNLLLNIHK